MKKVNGLAIVFFGTLWAAIIYGGSWLFKFDVSPPLSDKILVEKFQRDRSELDQLVEMLNDDREIGSLSNISFSPKDAIDKSRFQKYQTLIESVEIDHIIAARHEVEKFIFNIRSSSYDMRYVKGFVWSTKKPEPLFQSLDSKVKEIPPYEVYYKQIEENWYLYLTNNSD